MKYIEIDRLKIFIDKIKEKKERIETNYFNTLNIFNDVLKTTTNQKTINEITIRKEKLDTATNAAINTLDDVQRKLENALYQLEQDIEKGNWDNFDKAREIANDIDRAARINPVDVYNNRLEYLKELRDTVEYGDINQGWKDSEIYEFESIDYEFQSNDIRESYESPNDVKAGLLNDEQYAFEDKLNSLEKRLDKEIEKLRIQGETLESHKDAILTAIHNLEKNSLFQASDFAKNQNIDNKLANTMNPELYFSSLDRSVSNAVQKLDDVSEKVTTAISILSSENITNLEKISLPLIKSLETTVNNLTQDASSLRKENSEYRRQIDDYKKLIDNLTKDNREKEIELDLSHKSWLESTRKLNDLEEVIVEQTREIQILDDDKNQIISDLEKKILDTSDFLTQTIYEKEMLMRENQELVLTIQRIRKEHEDEKTHAIDDYVNTISIQDLIEKEANKIVENKITGLVGRYQDEIEKIKSNSLSYLLNENNNQEQEYVFDDLIDNAEKKEIEVLQQTIKKFEKKIGKLESQINNSQELKDRTEDAINDINQMIGNDPYNMISNEKSYLSNKFGQLEQKIEESLKRVAELEESQISQLDIKPEMSEKELNELLISSPLYGAIKNELHSMEKQVINLRNENKRITEENYVMNSALDETLHKLTINSKKMKEIEDLLTKQEYEYMMLNEEKNNVIETLYATLKEKDISNMDEMPNLKSLDKYDFNDFAKRSLDQKVHLDERDIMSYVKAEVEKIVGEELKILKSKYDKELHDINNKYNETIAQQLDGKETQQQESQEFEEFISGLRNNEFEGSNMLGENEIFDELIAKQQQIDENTKINKTNTKIQIPDEQYAQSSLIPFENVTIQQENEINQSASLQSIYNNDDNEIDGLDVSISSTVNEWEKIAKPIVSHDFATNKDLRILNEKNSILEQKILELQELINTKSYQQVQAIQQTPVVEQKQVFEIKHEVINPDNNDKIFNDLKASQEQQLREIEQRLESSLGMLKNDQLQQLDMLNQKIDNIKVENNDDLNHSVFDKYFTESNDSNKYLEKEIIESTDKLLKLQSLLLSLENEITREEKKVITNL